MRLQERGHGAPEGTPIGEGDGAGDRDNPAQGSWSATRWQYTARTRPGVVTDVVAILGGSVTMSLSAGAFVLSWDIPGHGNGSIGGVVRVADGELQLRSRGAAEDEMLRYRLTDQTLLLSSESSAWDFDGSGEEPAEFVAVLVRL